MAVTMTFNAAGNLLASQALAASANVSASFDGSTKFETQLTVKNTPGGTVAAARGVRIDVFPRYDTGPTDTTLANPSYTLPSQTASTAESVMIRLGPGKYTVKLTNLDASNGVTVEMSTATVDAAS